MILDQNGAESLLGQGDMLFSPVGSSRLQRIQGAYIDEPQIAKLTDMWRKQGEPELREELLEEVEPAEPEKGSEDEFDPDEDPLLSDAIRLVAEMQTASTSMLQRRLRLGLHARGQADRHARAARGDLWLRGFQAASGFDCGGGRAASARDAWWAWRCRGGGQVRSAQQLGFCIPERNHPDKRDRAWPAQAAQLSCG